MNLIFKTLVCLSYTSVFIAFTGCDDTVSAGLSEEFYISPGQQAEIKDSGLEITFNRVIEDSRCPKGAECVWEGNGRVEISVRNKGSADEIKELNTTLDPRQSDAGGFKIHLLDLQPYPEIEKKISPDSYRIRLVVEKE